MKIILIVAMLVILSLTVNVMAQQGDLMLMKREGYYCCRNKSTNACRRGVDKCTDKENQDKKCC